VARFAERSRIFDSLVQGCPPEVDPETIASSADLYRLCVNPTVAQRFQGVLDGVAEVEDTAVISTFVVGLFDATASNGWGRLTLLNGVVTPGLPVMPADPIIVAGRLPDAAAPDEVAMSDDAARVSGLHVGDTVRMAGWPQADLDAAIDGSIPPETQPFESTVVGVVRFLDDVQPSGDVALADNIPGDINLFAGAGWMAAHGADFSGYGSSVLVRLRGGEASSQAFEAAMSAAPEGWFNNVSSIDETSVEGVERVIDLERRALFVFSVIAIAAGMAFVALTAIRQLRRETADVRFLSALGMTHRDVRLLNLVRALTIAVPACLVATAGIAVLSPLGPVGLARRLEFDHPVRFDTAVVVCAVAALLLLFAMAALGTSTSTDEHVPRIASARGAFARVDVTLRHLGPVAATGATIRAGRSARTAVAAGAIAVAAAIAATGLVTSYDRLVADPERYGAWWDVAVGQYSEVAALEEGVAKLRANSAIIAASGYIDERDIAMIDGHHVPLLTTISYIGHHDPVLRRGRAPAGDSEIALGEDTIRVLHKEIGDEVTLVSSDDQELQLRVVGIIVVNDPIASDAGAAGRGAFLAPDVLRKIAGPATVPQSIVVQFDPTVDRAAAIESVRRDFPGSIRGASPQADIRNIGRLRVLPWLIAGLIGILALATLLHALVTMLARSRPTLAVLRALGFTRAQRRGAYLTASLALVVVGLPVGVVTGFVAADRVWQAVIEGVGVSSRSVPAWLAAVFASLGAVSVVAAVALVASRGTARLTPGEQLRVE
jgi:ABC-type lipoprotein release transport system permease subunit